MKLQISGRLNAFGCHLLFSIGVALIASVLVFCIWYPGLLASASGVTDIFLMLLAVDVVLGPIITLIIFNRQKKELKRDLAIIVVIQLFAMFYGLHSVYFARPVYMAYTLERFDTVYANELSTENLKLAKRPEFSTLPKFGPKYIAAPLPENPQEREKIVLEAVVGSGEDIQDLPQYYKPYENFKANVVLSLKPLERLKKLNNSKLRTVEKLIARYGAARTDVGYLMLKGKTKNLTVIISRASGDVLELIDLEP